MRLRLVARALGPPRPRWLRVAVAVAALPLLFGMGTCAQVAAVGLVAPPLTQTMLARAWEAKRWPRREPIDLAALPPHVPRAVVASEDSAFFLHDGFDWGSICRALDGPDGTDGRPRRGGSSITQQVARNVFLWQGRSWVRKGLETWYALLLELLLSKERILEIYLSVAEFGPLAFGIEAGARHHFGVPAARLSREQAARLAGILPSPRRWRVGGEAATERVAFVARNPAPWPTDPGFAETRARWRTATRGPCLPWSARGRRARGR